MTSSVDVRRIDPDTREALSQELAGAGTTLADILSLGAEVVLFGSRAIGRERAGSDWDVLIIGDGKLSRLGTVQFVWARASQTNSSSWLESGLITHVARYGLWLKGRGDWTRSSRVTEYTYSTSLRRAADRFVGSRRDWEWIPHTSRDGLLRWLRAELQRLALLLAGAPAPPAPVLDDLADDDPELYVLVAQLLFHDFSPDLAAMREKIDAVAHRIHDQRPAYRDAAALAARPSRRNGA